MQAVKAIAATDVFFVVGKGEVKHELVELREEARARKGWIMDTYLLRRLPPTGR
ncbi:hypothetical protein GCM10022419_096680 [Nonomuraea rosea]|uniref:Uncharacterized protein n=1 Tax=Nonomuraea rosea TaxID=638574 RepID=A0ABP6Z576_9ACTN